MCESRSEDSFQNDMPTDSKMACAERIYIGVGITKWRRRENFEAYQTPNNLKSLVVKGFIGISCIIRTFRLHLPISTVINEER